MKFPLMLSLLLLSACAAAPEPSSSSRRASTPAPTQLVAQVRLAGASGEELEVQPLRDPQVEDLRIHAEQMEASGKHKEADRALLQALALTPNDPDLVQWRAELALLRKAWQEAEQLANASYERGPKLGGLCRRNWTTVELSRQLRQDTAGAAIARKQREQCTIAPPVRM